MKQDSRSMLATSGRLFIAALVAGSFITAMGLDTAQAQQKQKRKFGPGQNALPKGVRPPAQRAVRPRQQKKPPAEIIAKHGKWVIQCDPKKPVVAGKAPAKRACAMIQTALHEKNKQIGLTLILARGKQGKDVATMMRIMAPISVYLPTGVALEIDGSAAGRVPFTRCLPQTCMAFAQVRKETLAKMKKGSKGKFLIYEAPGIGIPLNLDLTGFTAALETLDKTQ